ncbi:hypothetical protein DPEC_G00263210, partial [Dallia pectoralis]
SSFRPGPVLREGVPFRRPSVGSFERSRYLDRSMERPQYDRSLASSSNTYISPSMYPSRQLPASARRDVSVLHRVPDGYSDASRSQFTYQEALRSVQQRYVPMDFPLSQYPTRPEQYPTRPDQYPTRPDQYPTRPDQYRNRPDQYPTRPDHHPPRPDEYPTRPDQYPTRPDHHPPRPDHHPPRPDQYPTRADHHPLRPDQYPNRPDQYPTRPDQYPTRPDHHPPRPDQYPNRPDQYPTRPDQYPTRPDQYPPRPEQYPTRPDQYPTRTDQYPTRPDQYPTRPDQYPTRPDQYPTRPDQYPTRPDHHPPRPDQYPTRPDQHPPRMSLRGDEAKMKDSNRVPLRPNLARMCSWPSPDHGTPNPTRDVDSHRDPGRGKGAEADGDMKDNREVGRTSYASQSSGRGSVGLLRQSLSITPILLSSPETTEESETRRHRADMDLREPRKKRRNTLVDESYEWDSADGCVDQNVLEAGMQPQARVGMNSRGSRHDSGLQDPHKRGPPPSVSPLVFHPPRCTYGRSLSETRFEALRLEYQEHRRLQGTSCTGDPCLTPDTDSDSNTALI